MRSLNETLAKTIPLAASPAEGSTLANTNDASAAALTAAFATAQLDLQVMTHDRE